MGPNPVLEVALRRTSKTAARTVATVTLEAVVATCEDASAAVKR